MIVVGVNVVVAERDFSAAVDALTQVAVAHIEAGVPPAELSVKRALKVVMRFHHAPAEEVRISEREGALLAAVETISSALFDRGIACQIAAWGCSVEMPSLD